MSHPDPGTLALLALGEPIPADDRLHLDSCPACTTDVSELEELVALGREAPEELPDVPTRVWEGIRDELGLVGGAGPGASVVPLAPRRRRLFPITAAAAAAGAIVGGSVVWATVDRAAPEPDAGVLVAQAVLDPLTPAVLSAGTATVLDSPDGLVIRVDARGLPPRTGFYEVWLLDEGVTRLVALGALPSGSIGTFTIPPGVSVSEFPVVDISLEPYDGDPGHSHDSLMRGTLGV